jgi:hypothetical protein
MFFPQYTFFADLACSGLLLEQIMNRETLARCTAALTIG